MSKVFLTGGSGFLGSRVLERLARGGSEVIALDRSGSLKNAQVSTVPGDLLTPDQYRHKLAETDVVVHLAASTGRATRDEHFHVNAHGTEVLVSECVRAGIRKLLFVSSIAAKFPDKTSYYYAQAKLRAEEIVRASGLRFSIVRPTMILGPGSPILSALERLAGLPVIPVFGSGTAKVQPIYVDDVADFIVTMLERDMFDGRTFELGGPAVLTMEELIQAIRRARKGHRGTAMHVPLTLMIPAMRAAETIGFGKVLPFSVGQLSPFRYDTTIETNDLYESRRANLRDVSQMLALSFAA